MALDRHEILAGWKEIANYLRMAVRSLQRYERTGLPIHRPSGQARGVVIAIKAELDDWVRNGRVRTDSMQELSPMHRANRLGARFLQVDSDVALTFSDLALRAKDEGTKRHTTGVARKAYDSIMRLKRGIHLSHAERYQLDANLRRLKSKLQILGEKL